MQHFKWTKAHAVYLPQVDAEHRNLYRMAEEIQQSVHTGVEQPRVLDLVRALATSIEEHFTHEERIMKAAETLDYDWHKQQHDTARKRLTVFLRGLEAGEVGTAQEFLNFLARWFKDHMGLTDRMMGAHVRNYERLASKMAS
jgi:hemerythrin-like metal-binding protein